MHSQSIQKVDLLNPELIPGQVVNSTLKKFKVTLEDACSLVERLQLRGMEVPFNTVQGLVEKVVRAFQVGKDQSPCEDMTGSFRLQ